MDKYIGTVTETLVDGVWSEFNNQHEQDVNNAIAELDAQGNLVLFVNFKNTTEEVIKEDGTGYRTVTTIIAFMPTPAYRVTITYNSGTVARLGFTSDIDLCNYLLDVDDYQSIMVYPISGDVWSFIGIDDLLNRFPSVLV